MRAIIDKYRVPKIVLVDVAIILSLVMAFDPVVRDFVFFQPWAARAVGGHVAVNEIGQTDSLETGEPFYMSGAVNDGESVNAHHLANPGGIEVIANDPDALAYVVDTDNNRVVYYQLDYQCSDGCSLDGLLDSYPYGVMGQPDFRTNTSGLTDATLNAPTDILYANGYLFVTDTGNNRVLAFSVGENPPFVEDATADFVLGQLDFESGDANQGGVTPEDYTLSGPRYLAYESSEKLLFVTDSGNNRVMVFDLDSIATGMSASYVLGQADFTSNGAATTQTGMDYPTGITLLNNGYVYGPLLFVSDTNNNRVLAFDARPPGSDLMSTVDPLWPFPLCDDGIGADDDTEGIATGAIAACVLGQTDFTSSTGGLDDDAFSEPAALGVGYHRLYVGSYSDNRILAFNMDSTLPDNDGITNGEAAVDIIGFDSYTESDQCGLTDEAPCNTSVNEVRGIANYDFNNSSISVFVSDATHNRVLQFNGVVNGPDEFTADGLLGQVDKDAVFGSDVDLFNTTSVISQWGLNAPMQLAHDSAFDTLYIADSGNNRVMQYSLDGNNGVSNRSATNVIGQGYATDGEYGVEWYQDGGDFEYEGPFRSSLANWADEDSDTGPGDTVGNPTGYNLSAPSGVVYGDGYLYIFDVDNSRLQRFSTGGDYSAADVSVAVTATDERQMAYDGNGGRLFVPGGEDAGAVTVYDSDLNVSETGGSFGVGDAKAVAYDATNDRLFVSKSDCVFVYDAGIALDGQSPIGMLGDNDFDCTNGGASANSMTDPRGLVMDDTGSYLFVADTGNNRVLQFDVTTVGFDTPEAVDVFGQDDFNSNGSDTTQSSLSGPVSVLYLPIAQGIAVSDAGNNRVMFFALDDLNVPDEHIATDLVGQLDGSDLPVYTTNDPDNATTELSARFSSNYDVLIDTVDHRMFVADAGNNRVLVFDLDTNNVLTDDTPDNVLGQPDFDSSDDSFPPTQSSLNHPEGLAYHYDNELLFVSEGNNYRVVVYDLSGGITDGMPAEYVIGQTSFTATTSALDAKHVEYPGFLALDEDGNRLFVEDSGSGHSRVMVFDVSPANLASEAEGLGFATNAVNVIGPPNFTTFSSSCAQNRLFGGSQGLAYDSETDYLYVSTANRVLVFAADSITNGEAAVNVIGDTDFVTCVGSTTQTLTSTPRAMHIKYEVPKTLFLADSDRVLTFDLSDGVADGEAAVNVLGDADFTGTEALNDSMGSLVHGMFYEGEGNHLIVSDTSNSIIRFYDLQGFDDGESAAAVLGASHRDLPTLGTSPEAESMTNEKGLWEPHDISLDPENDRLYVADFNNNRVLVFELTADNELPDRVADYVLGQENMTTKYAGTRADRMDGPSGLVIDPNNNLLYVADYWNHRVLVFDTSAITDGQDALYVLGQAGFDNSTPDTTQTSLYQPRSVSLDPENGYLFVADSANNRVIQYNVGEAGENLADGMAAAAVYGQPDYVTGSSGLSDTALDTPVGVFGDPNNEMVWIADYNNNRVVGYAYNTTNASFVLGQTDMYSNTGAASITGLNGPWDMELDDASQLFYVSDANNNRLMVYDASDGLTDGEEAVDAYGQVAYDTSTAGTSDTEFTSPFGVVYDPDASTLWVADQDNNRVLAFGPDEQVVTSGSSQPPSQIGFFPDRISINEDDANVDGYNVLVNIHAHFSEEFSGTVDVLLSNVPDFSTTIPFRYNIPDQTARKNWPKTVSWDLCFGLAKEECDLGQKTVYARFYVNLPTAQPALTPIQSPRNR